MWKWAPRQKLAHMFNADAPAHGSTIHPPYVDIEVSFAYPTPAAPEVYDTLIEIGRAHV